MGYWQEAVLVLVLSMAGAVMVYAIAEYIHGGDE